MSSIGPTIRQVPTSVVPSKADASSSGRESIQLTLTHITVLRLWGLTLIVQCLNCVQLINMGNMYTTAHWDTTAVMRSLTRIFLLPVEKKFLKCYGIVFGVVYLTLGICFGVLATRMLWMSIRFRQLSFSITIYTRHRSRKRHNPVLAWARDIWVRYGIRGKSFEEAFLLREVIDITMQTAQAYATSLTISNVLINQAFGGLIVLSAVIHPIIDRVYAHDPATRRFASVLSEFFIDVIWGNILPIYVFVKYASLDRTIQTDQIFQRFGSGYYEIAQREVRHLVILSWPAFLLSIFPLVSSLISLHSLMRLLSAAKRISAPPSTRLVTATPIPTARGSLAPSSLRSGRRKTGHPSTMFLKHHSSSSPFLVWGHRGIILTGLIIWLISLASTGVFSNSSQVRSSDCLHRLSPWFVTSDACVITTLNCTALNITGRQDEMNSVMDSIHLSSLSALIVDSCPEFETPTALVHARSLVTLIITNTTLMSWSLDVALTTENFPRLTSFAFSGSTMPSPPPSGLVGVADWPDDLERIFVYETDIDELARSLNAQWSTITSFFCINCGLQTSRVPSSRCQRSKRGSYSTRASNTSPQFTRTTVLAVTPSNQSFGLLSRRLRGRITSNSRQSATTCGVLLSLAPFSPCHSPIQAYRTSLYAGEEA